MRYSSLRIAFLSSILTAMCAPAASAQDKGQVGLVVGYPTTVGVLWQISDRFGIRGDGTFSWSSSKTEEPPDDPTTSTFTYADGTSSVVYGTSSGIGVTQESSSVSGSVGISALITLTKSDTLRTYIAPRIAWAMSRSTISIEYDLSRASQSSFFPSLSQGLENRTLTGKSRTPSYGASFGASTTLRDRFGVFGELGFNYVATGSVPLVLGTTSVTSATFRDAHTVSLRSGIGVTFFF